MPVVPPWNCDTCGKPINAVDDGWVEWLSRPIAGEEYKRDDHSLRLVHQKHASPTDNREHACYHNEDKWYAQDGSMVSDLPLASFLGPDGLMTLLEFLSDKRFLEQDQVIEMIKRLHIPGYEQARHSFDAAIYDGVFEPNTKPGFYRQESIEATLRWKEERASED